MRTATNYLKHYGVRGMKWGVHRRSGSDGGSSAPEDVILKSRPGKPVVAEGGRNHAPSDDAKKAVAYRKIAKESSVHSLNNAELKLLVERMNLENNYYKLTAADRAPSKGKAFLQKVIKEEGGALVSGKVGPRTQFVQTIVTVGKGIGYNGGHAGTDYVGKRRSK